jgi:hypothetical protein
MPNAVTGRVDRPALRWLVRQEGKSQALCRMEHHGPK